MVSGTSHGEKIRNGQKTYSIRRQIRRLAIILFLSKRVKEVERNELSTFCELTSSQTKQHLSNLWSLGIIERAQHRNSVGPGRKGKYFWIKNKIPIPFTEMLLTELIEYHPATISPTFAENIKRLIDFKSGTFQHNILHITAKEPHKLITLDLYFNTLKEAKIANPELTEFQIVG
tara:strand:+ start:108 stop:632 length:525 start_codon:yes stop_codon:yes gene_type:complete